MKKCKSCQAEIPAGAVKCSHCGTDQRGWVARHKILTGILGIVVLFVLLGALGSHSSSSSSSTSGNNSGTSTNTSDQNQPSQAPQPRQAKIGDVVTDGDLSFTAQTVTTAHTLGSSFDPKTAQGVFYVITVRIQNNGKDTKTINDSDFQITDSQGRKYDHSTDGQLAILTSNTESNLFLQQVQPGLGVTGKIVFDVPATATGLKLLAQGGLFSDGVSIDLEH